MTISSTAPRFSSAPAQTRSQKEKSAPATPKKPKLPASQSGPMSATTAKRFLASTQSARAIAWGGPTRQLRADTQPGRLDGKLQDAAGRIGILANQAETLAGKSDPGKQVGALGQEGFGAAPGLPTHTFDVDLPADANVTPRRDFQSGLADGDEGGTTSTSESTDTTDSNGGQHVNESNTSQHPDGSTDTDVQTHDSDGKGNSTETQTVEHTNADGTKYGERSTTTTNADGSSTATHESWGSAPGGSSSSSSGSSREPGAGREPNTSSGSGSSGSSGSSTSGSSGNGSSGKTSSTSSHRGSSGANGTAPGRGGNPLPDPVGLESNGRVAAPYTPPSRTELFGTVQPRDIKSNPRPDDEPRSGEAITRPNTNGLTMPPDEFGGAHTALKPLLGRNFGKIDPAPPDQRQNAAALDPSRSGAAGQLNP